VIICIEHPADNMQLLDILLDEGKTVELMVYPGERHGVRGRKSVENGRSEVEFWKKHFFPEEVRPAAPVEPVRQEKQE